MQKVTLLFVLLLLGCGVIAYSVLFDSGEAAISVGPTSWEAPEADLAEERAGGPEGSETSGSEWVPGLPGGDSSQRVEIAGVVQSKPLVVMVYSGRRGVPAADAEVFFTDTMGGFRGFGRGGNRGVHWSEAAIKTGQKFKADAQGRVTLPPVRGMAMVTARTEGMYGFRLVRSRHKPIEEIVLVPDETLNVRVVDREGAGVGQVPVAVHQRVPKVERRGRGRGGRRQRGGNRGQASQLGQTEVSKASAAKSKPKPPSTLDLRVLRRTGKDGWCRIEHFQLFRRNAEKTWHASLRDQFLVSLSVPLLQPVSSAFSGRPVPAADIVLTMPATGSVALRIVDHGGEPFLHPASAELRVQNAANTIPGLNWIRGRKAQAGKGQQSAILFPFVGLGLQIRPHLWLDDRDFTWDGETVAGPMNPGERREIVVPISADYGIIRGRLLNEEGKPLARMRTTFLINDRAGRLEGEDLSTDDEGRFQLTYQRGKREPPFTFEIRYQKVSPPLGLTMRLPALFDGRVHDLGDLTIPSMKCIASGSVRDERGQPIPNASIILQRERMIGQDSPRLRWRDETFVQTTSDKAGHYSLHGDPPAGRFRLRVWARAHFSKDTDPIRLGGEIDVILLRNANLVGTILMPAWVPSRAVRVRLTSSTNSRQRRDDRVRDFMGKKFIYFAGVRPGFYDLEVLVAGFPAPVIQIQRLEIRAGETGVHRQLVDLDVRSSIFRFEISAVDDRGQAIGKLSSPLLAQMTRPDGKTSFVGFPWSGGKVEIFSTTSQLEIVQLAAGYRVQRQFVGAGKTQLMFSKLAPVRLRMPGLRGLIARDITVRVSMVLHGDTGLPSSLRASDQRTGKSRSYSRAQLSKSSGGWLRDSDDVMVSLMRDGKYSVVVRLRRGRASIPVVLGDVDVKLKSGSSPVFTLPVDVAKMQAGLRKVPPPK